MAVKFDWIEPKINWTAADHVTFKDLNRIEHNQMYLKDLFEKRVEGKEIPQALKDLELLKTTMNDFDDRQIILEKYNEELKSIFWNLDMINILDAKSQLNQLKRDVKVLADKLEAIENGGGSHE